MVFTLKDNRNDIKMLKTLVEPRGFTAKFETHRSRLRLA